MELLALFLMGCAGVLALAFAINYFWRTGPGAALIYAAFFVAMIFVFGATGLWVGASRHAWGVLTPLFALMLGAGWLLLKKTPAILGFIKKKLAEIQGK